MKLYMYVIKTIKRPIFHFWKCVCVILKPFDRMSDCYISLLQVPLNGGCRLRNKIKT